MNSLPNLFRCTGLKTHGWAPNDNHTTSLCTAPSHRLITVLLFSPVHPEILHAANAKVWAKQKAQWIRGWWIPVSTKSCEDWGSFARCFIVCAVFSKHSLLCTSPNLLTLCMFSPEQMPFSGQTPWVQPIPSQDLITWSNTHTAPLLRTNKQINTVLKQTVTHQVWRISNNRVKPLCMLLRQIKGLIIVIEGEVTPILSKAVVILKQMGRHSWKAFLRFTTRQHSFDFNSTPSPEPQKNENPRLLSLFASSPLVGGGGRGVVFYYFLSEGEPPYKWPYRQKLSCPLPPPMFNLEAAQVNQVTLKIWHEAP